MFSKTRNVLFSKNRLDSVLNIDHDRLKSVIRSFTDDQIISNEIDPLTENVYQQIEFQVIVLHEDSIAMEDQEGPVDVGNDPGRYFSNKSNTLIDGLYLIITLPFSGAPWLFDYLPNIGVYQGSLPHADVLPNNESTGGTLRFAVAIPGDKYDDFKEEDIRQEINQIRTFVNAINNDIEQFNDSLKPQIRQAVQARKDQLSRKASLLKSINIPLKRKTDAPDMQDITIRKRKLVELRQEPESDPEPSVSQENYEHILSVIRHGGKSFEETPRTFKPHPEEELRDILLAFLNVYFEGQATGETFRKKGKADIRIIDDKRSAFIAECKEWGGEQVLHDTLDQLQKYLTYRDCKASVILFNKKIKGFKDIQSKVDGILKRYQEFVSMDQITTSGEWRIKMKFKDDPQRIITVHVFLFNLFVE